MTNFDIQILSCYPAKELFEIVGELNRLTSKHKCIERFVLLAFSEIKVKSNLVFNKYNDMLNGLVDLRDPELNYSIFTD